MATYNRNPYLIDTSSKAYRDNSNYFNHVQFKGLCNNQNVDTIDPNTFQEVENLYVDQDDTLSSRPKLQNHDNFGFDSIDKMWIWDDVHLIYGTVVENNEDKSILRDSINSKTLDLSDETLNQIVRIENRIFIFLEGKVYVYEKVNDVYTFTQVTTNNVEEYFYIPETDGSTKTQGLASEAKNEITFLEYKFVLFETLEEGKLYIPDLENVNVEFEISGKTYKVAGWYKNPGMDTVVAPYTYQVFDKIDITRPKDVDGNYANTLSAVASLGSEIFYTLDGKTWESLPSLNSDNIYSGISKDGNFAWALLCKNESTSVNNGFYLISLVATEYPDGDNTKSAIKKYSNWTQIKYLGAIKTPDNYSVQTPGNAFYVFHPAVSVLTWDRWVIGFSSQMFGSYSIQGAYGHDSNGDIIFGYSYFSRRFSNINYEATGTDYWGIMDMQVYASYDLYNNTSGKYVDYVYIKLITQITNYSSSDWTPTIVRLAFNAITLGAGVASSLNGVATSYYLNNIREMTDASENLGGNAIRLGNSIATNCYQTLSEMPPYINSSSDKVEFYFTCIDMAANSSYYDPILISTYYHYVNLSGSIYTAEKINGRMLSVSQIPGLVNESAIETCVGKKVVMKDATTILTKSFLLKWKNVVSFPTDISNNTSLYSISAPTIPIKYKPGKDANTLQIRMPVVFYENFYGSRPQDNSILAFNDILTAYYGEGKEENPILYTNEFSQVITLKWYAENPTAENIYTNLYPQHFVETDNTQYWSFGQNLYIEDRRYTKDFKPLLYFPEINTEIRPNKITNLLVIDRGIVALFNEYEVWYVTKVTLEDSKTAYAYYKSRVGLGCKEGADIDIMYDGATITYASPRGVVGMNYQQLTQNTDQILTFLSDTITNTYFPFYEDGKIKIFKYKFWVVFYKENTYKCLILDLRNGSWWYWNSKVGGGLRTIYLYEDKPLLLDVNGQLMSLDDNNTGIYKDMDEEVIDWMATSQPLGFGALNNYKRIASININNVQLTRDPFNYVLICRNYKDKRNVYSPKVVGFEQERITVGSYRTFVKRLNYIQSVKFQYTIANNSDLPIQSPISITAISTKYEIKGRIR